MDKTTVVVDKETALWTISEELHQLNEKIERLIDVLAEEDEC